MKIAVMKGGQVVTVGNAGALDVRVDDALELSVSFSNDPAPSSALIEFQPEDLRQILAAATKGNLL